MHRADHLLVRAQHALGVDDALRPAGRARRVEDLRNRVGADPGVRVVDRAGRAASRAARRTASRGDAFGRRAGDDLRVAGDLRQRPLEQRRLRPRRPARGAALPQRAERRVVVCQQRVRRRERRVEHAGVHRRQAEQRVLEAVARQDDDRPIGREAAVEQRLRDCLRAPAQRVGVGEAPPRAVGVAPREERPVRRLLRPVLETLGDLGRIRAERDRRARVDACRPRPEVEDRLRREDVRHAGRGRGTCRRRRRARASSGAGAQRSPNSRWKRRDARRGSTASPVRSA